MSAIQAIPLNDCQQTSGLPSIAPDQPIPDPLSALKNRTPIYSKYIQDSSLIQDKLNKEFQCAQRQQKPFHAATRLGAVYTPLLSYEPPRSLFYFQSPAIDPAEGKTIHTETLSVGPYKAELAACQGKRKTMEDEHIAQLLTIPSLDKQIPLFGLFDGHGGKQAAQFLKENLPHYLTHYLEKFGLDDTGIWNALKHTFIELDHDFTLPRSGSTAAVALIIDNHIWIANLGDSRAILSAPKTAIQLSEDAKPDDPRYRKSIEKRGGRIFKHYVLGILPYGICIARTFGDHHLISSLGKNVMPHAPKITKHPILPSSDLILVCDGITDVATTKQISEAIQNKNTPSQIIAKAYNAGSKDNLSLMKVSLNV